VAHPRALARSPNPARWLLVSVALTLDGLAALYFAGYRHPLGLRVPEGLLVVAPLLVYGGLAFGGFRARPLRVRLTVLAVLLGLHVGLVALHALGFASLWSLPTRAAIRLAHRSSPLIPLLQLIWVPLLASPLRSLIRPVPRPRARQGGVLLARRNVWSSSGADSSRRGRPELDRSPVMMPTEPPAGPAVDAGVATETVAPAWFEPEPSTQVLPTLPVTPVEVVPRPGVRVAEPLVPATPTGSAVYALDEDVIVGAVPTPVHDATTAVSDTPVVVDAEPAEATTAVSDTPVLVDAEPADVTTLAAVADATGEPATVTAAAVYLPVDLSPIPIELEPQPESIVVVSGEHPCAADPALAVAAPELPMVAAVPPPVEPPLDLSVVTRLFAPYGSLLSRDGAVPVDWTPRPHASIVCVAPHALSRERLVDLADRLVQALTAVDVPAAPHPVRRLSLHGSEGVIVLTLLDGGVLIAASSRFGALGLLEALSERVVPGPASEARAGRPDTPPAGSEVAIAGAVRIETTAATLDVLAPAGADLQLLSALAGRLLAAIGDGGHARARRTLGVDLGAARLMLHPVHPDARPPRFVMVVGGVEPSGLLGRRAERVALTLREAS
jgi:hypothetical protein